VPPGCLAITSPVAGSVWKLGTAVGAVLQTGDPVVIVEAMKTEIVVAATVAGTVQSLLVAPGAPVMPGQVLAFVEERAP
jgi:urea carboxylase